MTSVLLDFFSGMEISSALQRKDGKRSTWNTAVK